MGSNAVRIFLGALVLTVIAVGVGVLTVKSDEPEAEKVKGDLSTVDTTVMHVRRGSFCSQVPAEDVTDALGGTAAEKKAYDDGDQAELAGVTDVAQEYGCEWTGSKTTATSARAWVFAPPVTRDWATRMNKSVPKGCKSAATPRYGKPSTSLTCTDAKTKQSTVTLRGLFGDAWLSCELTGKAGESAAAVQKRASRWCLVTADAATAA